MNRTATHHPLILIALVNLPIEVILITISGRSIIHYYLTLLPVMAILTGILIYAVPRLLENSRIAHFKKPTSGVLHFCYWWLSFFKSDRSNTTLNMSVY